MVLLRSLGWRYILMLEVWLSVMGWLSMTSNNSWMWVLLDVLPLSNSPSDGLETTVDGSLLE